MIEIEVDGYTAKRFCKDLAIVGSVAAVAGFIITGSLRLLNRIG